jgi:hypothetical protein
MNKFIIIDSKKTTKKKIISILAKSEILDATDNSNNNFYSNDKLRRRIEDFRLCHAVHYNSIKPVEHFELKIKNIKLKKTLNDYIKFQKKNFKKLRNLRKGLRNLKKKLKFFCS